MFIVQQSKHCTYLKNINNTDVSARAQDSVLTTLKEQSIISVGHINIIASMQLLPVVKCYELVRQSGLVFRNITNLFPSRSENHPRLSAMM